MTIIAAPWYWPLAAVLYAFYAPKLARFIVGMRRGS